MTAFVVLAMMADRAGPLAGDRASAAARLCSWKSVGRT